MSLDEDTAAQGLQSFFSFFYLLSSCFSSDSLVVFVLEFLNPRSEKSHVLTKPLIGCSNRAVTSYISEC